MPNFTFTGKLSINPADAEKRPGFRKGTTKKTGAPYESFNASVSSAKNNSGFIELFGMESDTIRTMDTDNNKIEVLWSDRHDENVVNTVASYKKNVLKIGDDRKSFISPYDMVKEIENNVDLLNGETVTVTGQTKVEFYEGKMRTKFQLQNVYTVDSETKPSLRVTMILFFNKDSYDFADYASEKKIAINGYISEYIDKDYGNKYVPQTVILDASKLDLENPKHLAMLKVQMKNLGIDYNDGKPKCNLKGNNYYSMNIITNYCNGAEEKEISYDDLTSSQKELIDVGLKTLDDFKDKAYGDRVTLYKVVTFNLKGDYEDGLVNTDMKASEFEEEIYTPFPMTEDITEMVDKAVFSTTQADEDEMADLFG